MKENKKEFNYRLIFYLVEIPLALAGHFILEGDDRTPSLGFFITMLFMVLGGLWVVRDVLHEGKFKFLAHLIGFAINIALLYFIIP
ncbi:MAG TPA: hypothetical protein VD908_00085 [Cytophagales bacterium]|nr:hypothetical protein [Cytophagales bacterium]